MSEPLDGRIDVGLRRVPELEPRGPRPESDPGLVARIRSEIEASGPMTFARFMELALYDPEAGYYAALEPAGGEGRGPGRHGDFLTAPESHPIFGWAIARRMEQAWVELGRPSRFMIREHGAGAGALAVGILGGLRRSGSALLEAVRYQAIEVSPWSRNAFASALDEAGLSGFVEPVDDRPAPGAAIANELLDALPVHRVEGGADGTLQERLVTIDPRDGPHSTPFTTVLAPASTAALAERLEAEDVSLELGQAAEICLAIDAWVRQAVEPLERGLLLVVDYGYPASELYTPTRGSMLRAYHRHRVHADPFVAIGRQDLTAHVDLTAVERAAVAAGLQPLRRTRQGEYLAGLGLGELLVELQTRPEPPRGSAPVAEADPATALEGYLAARSAVARMLDPGATGGFAVLELWRG